jgi:hypothetical protein
VLLLVVALLAIRIPLRDFLAGGGWAQVRRTVRRALLASALTLGAIAGVVLWAHQLPAARRDGSDLPYALAVVAMSLLVAGSACAWAAVATRTLGRLTLDPRVLRLHALLACAVTAALAVMTVAAAVWWAAVGVAAPWFFDGHAAGSGGSPWDPSLIVVLCVMVLATALAGHGTRRILGARPWAPSTV